MTYDDWKATDPADAAPREGAACDWCEDGGGASVCPDCAQALCADCGARHARVCETVTAEERAEERDLPDDDYPDDAYPVDDEEVSQ